MKKTKVYVDWRNQEVISETKYKTIFQKTLKELMDDKTAFYEWLNRDYTPKDIWELTKEDRVEIQILWKLECQEIIEIQDDFEPVEIED